MSGGMGKERYFGVEVDYQQGQVPADVDAAIEKIMRDAARMITAKLALLSNPSIVHVRAQSFVDGVYKDIRDEP